MESLFRVEHLSKSFGGLKAIDDLSFELKRGSFFSIIGPNGAGKSTVFNCINGLYKPDSGNILLESRNLTRLKPHQIARRGIGRTFQNLELFSNMTTMENLMLGRHMFMKTTIWNLPTVLWPGGQAARDEIENRHLVEKIIDLLDLQSARNTLVSQLPYGRQKVVELGRALAADPRLLMLDEPAAGLNNEEKEEMIFWLQDIRAELGITILMIEHNMKMVTRVSDRILALNFGRTLVEGTVEEVVSHPDVIKAFLG